VIDWVIAHIFQHFRLYFTQSLVICQILSYLPAALLQGKQLLVTLCLHCSLFAKRTTILSRPVHSFLL
jgi:hypothetical protein